MASYSTFFHPHSDMDDASGSFAQTEDQFYILYLIIGTYFGPDLKEEKAKKSALRRMFEACPPYTSNQLAGTCIRTSEVERLYYYILREADQSVILPLPLFYQFFHGIHLTPIQGFAASYPKFSELFPPGLHHLVRAYNGYHVIENIVFVNDPDVSYITPKCLERYKKLTGLQNFLLDGGLSGPEVLPLPAHNGSLTGTPYDSNGQFARNSLDGHLNGPSPLTCPSNGLSPSKTTSVEAMLVLPMHPSAEALSDIVAANKRGYAITGSAASGKIGPVLGLLDIGDCEDAYLFRISLPGVTRDEREFSCEVENDGTVIIKGVTTGGEKTVHRYSQMFEMQTQNLCPSGYFSLSFKLPGPVNPQKFSGTFGTDAILEGIVMKAGQNKV
ncbi:unnamed protein product [Cuscuta epithymum]|uniref:SHSP domain-containing protein n=2 Tax=Cuscuta epithymum TaxID=186058 RepID=A0AAV0EFX2_9ASTE|nr:unnamed protein product [Cuscuta epithymum]